MNSKLVKLMKWSGITVAGLIIIYTVLLVVSGVKLRNVRERLVAGGRSMTAEAIIPASIADSDNAALLYKSAAMALRAGGDLWSQIKPEELAGTNREEVIKYLDSEEVITALELVKKGTGKAGCRYDLDYTKGPGILLPHISELRSLERLLAAQTKLKIERGDYEGAWKNAEIGYKLANALLTEPILISQLVRIAMFGVIDQVVIDLCKVCPPNEVQCEAIRDTIKPFAEVSPVSAVCGMDAERVLMGEWVFRQPASEFVNLISIDGGRNLRAIDRIAGRIVFCKMCRQSMQASYLNVMAEMTKFMEAPYWEAPVSSGRLIEDNIPRWDIFSRMLVPAISSVKGRHVSLLARAVLTQTAMGLIQHKLVHNGFPVTLAECDAKYLSVQPVDPFSGQPLIYRLEGKGFVLYSVGENMKDDGGKPEPDWDARAKMSSEEQNDKSWDLVWKY